MPMTFHWARLDHLTGVQFHDIIAHRERVFIVEQNCPFQDADEYDAIAWHLVARIDGQLAAYLRIVDAGHKYAEASIGRVLTAQAFRGMALGKALMQEAFTGMHGQFSQQPIRISAQAYLLEFYRGFGFTVIGDEYLEDNIAHYEMLRLA